jgi:hypothetical protein
MLAESPLCAHLGFPRLVLPIPKPVAPVTAQLLQRGSEELGAGSDAKREWNGWYLTGKHARGGETKGAGCIEWASRAREVSLRRELW